MKKYVEVLLLAHVEQPFVYRVPVEMEDQIDKGSFVIVPLRNRQVEGVIYRFLSNENLFQMGIEETSLKKIIEIFSTHRFPDDLLKLVVFVSQYYLVSIGHAFSLFLPKLKKFKSHCIFKLFNLAR